MKKILCLLLALSMLTSLAMMLFSCGKHEPEEETPKELKIVENGETEYVIVRDINCGKSLRNATSQLRAAIAVTYGADISVTVDTAAAGDGETPRREIIIGNAARPECENITEGLTDAQYIIKAVGNNVVISGVSDSAAVVGVRKFIDSYIAEGESSLVVPADLSITGAPDMTYCEATSMTYRKMADEIYSSFMKKFYETRTRWVTGADFWKSAEILESFIDAYEATGNSKYLKYVEDNAAAFLKMYGTNWLSNEYNDDIMWITIAFLRIYKLTGDESYYTQAKSMYDGVYKRGWSSDLGGGIWWRTDNQTKNACINCPAAIAACYIYEISGDDKYLKQAEEIIAWVVDNIYEKNGHVYDSYNINGQKSDWASTYNQGTFIGANTLLYQKTGDEKYIGYADSAVSYTINNMFGNGVMNGEDSGGDLPGFKGILTRWIYRYAVFRNDLDVLSWLQLNARTAYSNQNSNGLVWTKWGTKTADKYSSDYNSFGFSTVVALMYNSLPWWSSDPAASEGTDG